MLNLPAGRLIALAALAGILAGGLAVYVTGQPSGNNGDAAVQAAARPSCEGRETVTARVDEAAKGEVAAMLATKPSRAMPALSFEDGDGAATTLDDLSGKTRLINLWATWCAPCRAEMPALDALERELGGEDFEVVAINVDTGGDEKPRAFLQEIGVTALGYYRDETMGVFNELKKESLAIGLPVTLLVDDEGCLLAHMNGPAEWASDDAKALIEAARMPRDG